MSFTWYILFCILKLETIRNQWSHVVRITFWLNESWGGSNIKYARIVGIFVEINILILSLN